MRFKFKLRFPEFQVFLYKAKILLIQIVPALDELNKEGSLINTKAKIGGFDKLANSKIQKTIRIKLPASVYLMVVYLKHPGC